MSARLAQSSRRLLRAALGALQLGKDILGLVPARKRAIVIGGLFVTSVLELAGLAMIIPLLATATQAREARGLTLAVQRGLEWLHVPFDPIVLLTAIVVALSVKAVVGIAVTRYVSVLVGNISRDYQIRLTRAILQARWDFVVGQPLGRLVQASGPEAVAVGECFEIMTKVIAAILITLLFLTIAALISWELLALILFIAAMVFLSFGRLAASARAQAKAHRENMRQHAAQFTDAMIGFKQIRAMGRIDRFAHLFERQARLIARSLRQKAISAEYAAELQEPVIGGLLAGAFFLAMHSLDRPLTDVVIMALLLVRTLSVLMPIQRYLQRLLQAYDLYHSLTSLLATFEAAQERSGGGHPPRFERAITFEGVTFGYGTEPIIRDFGLEIRAGQITAISGPSGIGKSTIVDLVVGLYHPQQGTVLVDGVPLGHLDLTAWRREIGYVPQEITLFHDTIYNNVALWQADVPEDDVERALRAADAWAFVNARPGGIRAIVGERGHRLSGGQRQRISIARALLHQPKLLIMDEATTGLDPETERQICERMRNLAREQGLTVLAVSHQPTWRSVADHVYTIADGQAFPLADPRRIPA